MRMAWSLIAVGALCALAGAQGDPKAKTRRYGYDLNDKSFPQKTPAQAMASIAKALDGQKIDYLLAQLADPLYVDYWIDRYKDDFPQGNDEGRRLLAFERLARETGTYYLNDPLIVKELRIFAKEAKWEEKDDLAIGAVDKIPARKVYLRKIGERWFIENKQQ